jgi:hypothetical protein
MQREELGTLSDERVAYKPSIFKGFIDFLGLFGKGYLERVKGIEPSS